MGAGGRRRPPAARRVRGSVEAHDGGSHDWTGSHSRTGSGRARVRARRPRPRPRPGNLIRDRLRGRACWPGADGAPLKSPLAGAEPLGHRPDRPRDRRARRPIRANRPADVRRRAGRLRPGSARPRAFRGRRVYVRRWDDYLDDLAVGSPGFDGPACRSSCSVIRWARSSRSLTPAPTGPRPICSC